MFLVACAQLLPGFTLVIFHKAALYKINLVIFPYKSKLCLCCINLFFSWNPHLTSDRNCLPKGVIKEKHRTIYVYMYIKACTVLRSSKDKKKKKNHELDCLKYIWEKFLKIFVRIWVHVPLLEYYQPYNNLSFDNNWSNIFLYVSDEWLDPGQLGAAQRHHPHDGLPPLSAGRAAPGETTRQVLQGQRQGERIYCSFFVFFPFIYPGHLHVLANKC